MSTRSGRPIRNPLLHSRHLLERLAWRATQWTGSSWAFGVAVFVVVSWLLSGPLFGYSDTWQLIINTGTTIATFLVVFLIQRTQNKDTLAVQLKLNEIVAAIDGASNRLIDVEDLDEEELQILETHFRKLSQMAKRDARLTASHSVEEAETRHRAKQRSRQRRTSANANANQDIRPG
jgi:low affinity Fe/Cu permease